MASVLQPSDLDELLKLLGSDRHKLHRNEALRQLASLALNELADSAPVTSLQESVKKLGDKVVALTTATEGDSQQLLAQIRDLSGSLVNREHRQKWASCGGFSFAEIAGDNGGKLPVTVTSAAAAESAGGFALFLWVGGISSDPATGKLSFKIYVGSESPTAVCVAVADGCRSAASQSALERALSTCDPCEWCAVGLRVDNASERAVFSLIMDLFGVDQSPVRAVPLQRPGNLSKVVAAAPAGSRRCPLDLSTLDGTRSFYSQLVAIVTEVFAASKLRLSPSQTLLRKRIKALELSAVVLHLQQVHAEMMSKSNELGAVKSAIELSTAASTSGEFDEVELAREQANLRREAASLEADIAKLKGLASQLENEKKTFDALLTRSAKGE